MASINDWAAKAAQYIASEYDLDRGRHAAARVERLAAIIATFAQPLMDTLRASRRGHFHCDDSWYCCPQCNCSDHGLAEGETIGANHSRNAVPSDVCTCGADEWNKRVDAALDGV
jgi:hypothetical protein